MTDFFLQPESIQNYVRLNADEPDWKYNPKEDSIFDKQAAGISYCWNLLQRKKIALLADEVGMGKTIQALAVISILLKLNPKSRILIFAPREIVQNNWIREIKEFQKHDIIRENNADTLHKLLSSESSLIELLCVKEKESEGKNILLTRTTSLSYLDSEKNRETLSSDFTEVNEEKWKEKAIDHLRKLLLHPKGKLDLLVIDEAHLFRNTESESNRAEAARQLFKDLAEKVLLLTATPNHSHESDIQKIVGLFDDTLSNENPKKILEEICIRRPRRMERLTKYEYRNEEALEANFRENPASEIFFALYQKKLQKRLQTNLGKNKLFFGYLEAFESFRPSAESESENEESDKKKLNPVDIHKSNIEAEREILKGLTAEFETQGVSHPKYDRVIDELLGTPIQVYSLYKQKALAFVRRIASAKELSARYNENLDKFLLEKLEVSLIENINKNFKWDKNKRESIIECFSASELEDGTDNFGPDSTETEQDEETVSEDSVLSVFRSKKEKKDGKSHFHSVQRTHPQNFRERFMKPASIFSVFFFPGSDLFSGMYPENTELVFRMSSDRNYSDYPESFIRFLDVSEASSKDGKEYRKSGESLGRKTKTFFSCYFSSLKNEKASEKEIFCVWEKLSKEEKLNCAEYIKKGLLFASPYILDLYCWYLECLNKKSGKSEKDIQAELYDLLIEKAENEFNEGKISLKTFISDAILHYQTFKGKVCSEKESRNWNLFHNQKPSYGYTAGSNNQEVLNSFNSPFFPYSLFATSVLQEGVNLHFYCSRVIHYGIAWTAGDNEQRNGRTDRLFGKIHKEIIEKENSAQLDIIYPYLSDSIDEEQTAQFLQKKYEAENLIDRLHTLSGEQEGREFLIWNESVRDWKEHYLRKKKKGTLNIVEQVPEKAKYRSGE